MALVALEKELRGSAGGASAWAWDLLEGLAGVVFLIGVLTLAWLLMVAAEDMIIAA